MVLEDFKNTGTTAQLKDRIFSYSEYEQVVNLSKWLEFDKKFE